MSEPSPTEARPQRRSEGSTDTRLWMFLTVIVAGVGLALRIWILRSPAGRLDSDEAVVALMADSIRTGHKPTLFFAGQYYGGMYEPILTAFALTMHRSVLAVKLVPMACSALSAVLTTRIAWRIVTPDQARLAGAVLFAWPGTTWLATKERGFYWVMLLLILVALLSAVRLAQHEPHRVATWCVYGGAVGSAWYTSPQSVYVVVPLSIWLLFTQRPRGREFVAVAVGSAIGAIPWLYGLASFGTKVLHQEPASSPYIDRLRHVTFVLLPRVLGTRRLFAEGWTFGAVGHALWIAIAVAVIACSVCAIVARGRGRNASKGSIPVMLCLLACSFPFLAAVPSLAMFTAEPRYGLLLVPTAVLLLTVFATNVRRALLVVVLVTAFSVMSTVDLLRIANVANQPQLDLVPSDTSALVRMLHDANITRVYADYWVTYPLTFRSPNGLIASPLDLPRLGAVQQTVDAAKATTWIVYVDSIRDRGLGQELRSRNISVTRRTVGPFAVYILDQYVNPLTLGRFWVDHPPGR